MYYSLPVMLESQKKRNYQAKAMIRSKWALSNLFWIRNFSRIANSGTDWRMGFAAKKGFVNLFGFEMIDFALCSSLGDQDWGSYELRSSTRLLTKNIMACCIRVNNVPAKTPTSDCGVWGVSIFTHVTYMNRWELVSPSCTTLYSLTTCVTEMMPTRRT